MSVLLQISDTHFGTEQPPVVEAVVALAARQRPDLVVLSGDITQRARRDQFQRARAFVDRLGAPWIAIPGNHDIPLFNLYARFVQPYANHVEAFGEVLEPVHETASMLVLGVNTTRNHRHTVGEVSQAQVERVARRIANAGANQLRVVVVHQPVAVTQPSDVKNLLRGHDRALARWAAAGADVVLGGHIHLPYVIAPDGLARPLWVVQAGTAVSSRIRDGAPNSVNILRWSGDGDRFRCDIEQWNYAAGDAAFVLAKVTSVEPVRS
jgi:3',5'-cyclic AMP phosphodiesterase CpdA